MQTIHWLGAGLSSAPGIRRLATGTLPLVLWNRTVSRAEQAVAGIERTTDIRAFELDALAGVGFEADCVRKSEVSTGLKAL